ncbi:hypothetical protein PSTG_16013 [Puccinia striiformis f. sp. tritici PST-78]|uniref:protein-tyrosine-phosphatase n=1 Tax=Puccinia striiformis f. sp. tritici PST-78 TaxID=1165861 RepID=A0A0L0UUE5_9BASI|nr:hypothetical protein PSTG_16013 [Puccinia striiformis f. sp. tritici PST-78]
MSSTTTALPIYQPHQQNDEQEEEEEEEEDGQYPTPMNNPYAEIEDGWRKSISGDQQQQQPAQAQKTIKLKNNNHSNDQVLNQLGHFSFNNKTNDLKNQPLSMNLFSMRRTEGSFRPPNSSSASKNSFSSSELTLDHSITPRTRLSSFSTDLEPISASPTSPNSPYSFPTTTDHHQSLPQFQLQPTTSFNPPPPPPRASRASLPTSHYPPVALASSSTSSFSSSDDGLLLRRASSSSLASVGSVCSSTNGLKARRGFTKPLSLSLAVPTNSHQTTAQALATPLRARHDSSTNNSAFSRSLPPSPKLGDLGQARAQFVGMKANVTGGLSMKRRTSIPRLSLGGISTTSNDHKTSRGFDPVRLIGRNNESVMNTPIQLHFDPIAANQGRTELMSSQAGTGGKGHIEIPSELTESFPYEHGPKEVLTDVYLGSEQNARDANLLSSMGFGLIINVAKEVECPWEPTSSPAPIQQAWPNRYPQQQQQQLSPNHHQTPPKKTGLMVRPTASTPNLKRSFEGKIRVSLPEQPTTTTTSQASSPFEMKRLDADRTNSRPSLDYIKLAWSHDQDGLTEIFNSSEVFSLIDKARSNHLKTLVHCQCGVSRSATFVIGYCMREAFVNPNHLKLSGKMHDAYSFVKEKSPWAGPNMGLIYQLIEYEKVLFKARRAIVEEEEEEDVEDDDNDEDNSIPHRLSDDDDHQPRMVIDKPSPNHPDPDFDFGSDEDPSNADAEDSEMIDLHHLPHQQQQAYVNHDTTPTLNFAINTLDD